MKSLLTSLLLLQSLFAFAQTEEIVHILNQELKKEERAQKKDAANYPAESFQVVKPFGIKDSTLTMTVVKEDSRTKEMVDDKLVATDLKILSIEVNKKSHDGTFYVQKQEVDLRKIKAIVKDINVIFETEPDAVVITQTNVKGEPIVRTSDLFFLNLSYDKQNESLADELIKAFAKAGYEIEKGVWFD